MSNPEELTVEDFLKVPCRFCKSPSGSMCVSSGFVKGRDHDGTERRKVYPHSARRKEAAYRARNNPTRQA